MADLASVRLTVAGRVTGIGFRAFARAQARMLGLTGYVRNLPDGKTVAVEAEGEREKLDTLIACLKSGPPLSKVERIEVDWSEYRGIYRDFSIRF